MGPGRLRPENLLIASILFVGMSMLHGERLHREKLGFALGGVFGRCALQKAQKWFRTKGLEKLDWEAQKVSERVWEKPKKGSEMVREKSQKGLKNGLAEPQKAPSLGSVAGQKPRNPHKWVQMLHFEGKLSPSRGGQSFDQGGSPILFCFENGKIRPPLDQN